MYGDQADVVEFLVQELDMDVNECADDYSYDIKKDGRVVTGGGRLPGATPLTIAVFRGHMQTARRLVALGADVNKCSEGVGVTDETETSPLHMAAVLLNDYDKHPELPPARLIIRMLVVELGATVDNRVPISGLTPLIKAAQEVGTEDNVRTLLELGADLNAVTPIKNTTALHLAAVKENLANFKVVQGRSGSTLSCV